ncbi:MAG: efflux RND transporter periplasmic adaptor subunit [Clostridiales bacterium]|nr:efflux RND transporter periplasmic adaptor subunit [Clostridiales bacterium]
MQKIWKHKKIFMGIAGSIIILVIAIWAIPSKKDADEEVIWREYPVTYDDITASLDGGGTLEVTGNPHTAGVELKIEEVMVKEGQEVKKGDILVKFSVEDLQKKVDELDRSLKAAEREAEDAKNNKTKEQMQDSLNAVEKQQSIQSEYESRKRDAANTITGLEQKKQQIEKKLAELRKNLQDAENAAVASAESMNQKKSELSARLEEVVRQMEELQKQSDESETPAEPETENAEAEKQQAESEGLAEAERQSEESGKLAQLEAEKADLEKQIADLDAQMEAGEGKETIAALEEQIRQAESELEGAKAELETQQRSMGAIDSDYASKQEQNKKTQAIQGGIDALDNAALDNVIENAAAETAKITDELEAAKKLLETPILRSELDGIVTAISYTEGDTAPGGKSIVTIGDSDEKLAVTQISEEEICDIEVGQEVEMQFAANPDETLKGKVKEKSLVPTQGGEGVNYKVSIAFDEPQPELLQGMTCSIKFVLKRVEKVLTLDNKAVTQKDGKQVVTLLLPDGSHEEREIKTGFSNGRVSEITGGLKDGDVVVIEG